MKLKLKVSKNHWKKVSPLRRFIARKAMEYFLDEQCTFQVYGHKRYKRKDGSMGFKYYDISTPAPQIAHWVLRDVGYDLTINDLNKIIEEGR